MNKKEMEKSIPKGMYCYDENGNCPWWSSREDKPNQENGYCSFLELGDWEENPRLNAEAEWKDSEGNIIEQDEYLPMSLLWDQCKECGINDYTEEEWDKMENDLEFSQEFLAKFDEAEYCKCKQFVVNLDDIYRCKRCNKYQQDVRKKG